MATIHNLLITSVEPSIRYLYRRDVQGEDASKPEMLALQEEIRTSERVTGMLLNRGEDGRYPWHAYDKWAGAFWTLLLLTEIGYPPGDQGLIPLRDQTLEWLLSEKHLKNVPLIDGRWRRCALQEASIVYAMLKLGIVDDRITQIIESLLKWQWPDGGWNCDRIPTAANSSFHETWIPLRAMHAYAQISGDARAREAAEKACDVFLSRCLFKRKRDGAVMSRDFVTIAYPNYWHYDVLAGLRTMAEVGRLSDPRCVDALDWLESKRLPGGGFAAEKKYYRAVENHEEKSGISFVDWGGAGRTRMNEFVTVNALAVLKQAGRSLT